MLRKLTLCTILTATLSASAITAPADSTALDSISLGEVTVTAAPVIRKADRDVYVPNAQLKDKSSDGLNLLQNLQIPSIFIDNVMETVTAGGNDVQFRINGREATLRDVKALEPSSIVRVEYMDDPGLRYKGATDVVNFIVRNPTLGGSLMLSAMTTLNRESLSNGFISTKLNNGRSQWGIEAFGNNLANFAMSNHGSKQYIFPTQTIERKETSSGRMGHTWIYGNLYYNYLVPDKTNIYIQAQSGFNPRNKNYMEGITEQTVSSRAASALETTDQSSHRATYPSLNFYFDQKLSHKQTLVFSLTTGWRREKAQSYHSEYDPLSSVTHESELFANRTRVNNFDITGELNYIKEWNQTQLTAGINYYQAWCRTHYYEPVIQLLKQRVQNAYYFAEVTQKIKAFTLSAGIGAENIHQVSGADTRENDFVWRPRFSASWRVNDYHRLRLTFNANSYNPSLGQLSDIWTMSDPYRGSIGNPNLKSNMNYDTRLSYQYTHPRVQLQFETGWLRSPGAVMSYNFFDADRNAIVQSYANSSGNRLRLSISPRITVVKDWLTVSGRLQFERSLWHGPDYRLCQSSFSGNYSAELTHWNFSLIFQGYFAPETLRGQEYNRNERIQMIILSYKYKKFNFTTGLFNAYGRHDFTSATNSKNYKAHSVNTIADHPIFFVQLNYNLQWGRQKRQGQRLIDGPSQPSSGGSGVGM